MHVFFCLALFILTGCAGDPAPQDTREVVLLPTEEAAPENTEPRLPASAADLPLFLSSYLSPSKRPVIRGGSPLAFIRRDMIVLLSVRTQDPRKAAFTHVSNFERLFDAEAEELPFYVEVFTVDKGKVVSRSIDAGRHRVCGSFTELPFPAAQAFPFGVSLVFPDTEGKRSFWVLFPGAAQDPAQYSVFSFYEQANVKAFIRDIDGNGTFDLLLFEDIFEDSSGYETYITWHRWDGKSFVKYRSTNIVRRLRAFFASSRQMLLSRSWRRFFDYALIPEDSGALQKLSTAAAFRRIFRMQEENSPEEEAVYGAFFPRDISRSIISEVVFPSVVQNPFPPQKDGGYGSFPFTIRISSDEESYFLSARLALNKNPFSGRMFHFLPGE